MLTIFYFKSKMLTLKNPNFNKKPKIKSKKNCPSESTIITPKIRLTLLPGAGRKLGAALCGQYNNNLLMYILLFYLFFCLFCNRFVHWSNRLKIVNSVNLVNWEDYSRQLSEFIRCGLIILYCIVSQFIIVLSLVNFTIINPYLNMPEHRKRVHLQIRSFF